MQTAENTLRYYQAIKSKYQYIVRYYVLVYWRDTFKRPFLKIFIQSSFRLITIEQKYEQPSVKRFSFIVVYVTN